jgi:hypothetical protein
MYRAAIGNTWVVVDGGRGFETPKRQKKYFCVRFVTKMSAEDRSKLRELMMRVEMITRGSEPSK